MFLSIFNNGSQAWILLVPLAAWILAFGSKVRSHIKAAKAAGVKWSPTKDSDAKLLAAGVIGILGFLIWINADYAK